jgi:undecaprenyl-diphosphatase
VKDYSKEAKLGLAVLVGCIPAGVLGVLVGDFLENFFRSILAVAAFLIFGSVLMFWAEKQKPADANNPSVEKGFLIGLFQCIALLPGISRSGSTISGGMLLGFNREVAARFSFLLSIPVVLGAGLYQLLKYHSELAGISTGIILVGFFVSFLSGILSIKFLLKFVKTHSLYLFIVYRLGLGALLIVVSIALRG